MRTWAPRSCGIQLNALVGGCGEHWVGAQPVYRVSGVDQREAIVFVASVLGFVIGLVHCCTKQTYVFAPDLGVKAM